MTGTRARPDVEPETASSSRVHDRSRESVAFAWATRQPAGAPATTQARLGDDSGAVRAPGDERSATSARAVDALAYAVGGSDTSARRRGGPGSDDHAQEATDRAADGSLPIELASMKVVGVSMDPDPKLVKRAGTQTNVLLPDDAAKAPDFGATDPEYEVPDSLTFEVVKNPSKEPRDVTAFPEVIAVHAQLTVKLHWGTDSNGRTDITGPKDPDVTAATWRDVVKDLTPNEIGYAPRDHYWAQDLVVAHEKVHQDDAIDFASRNVKTVQNLLGFHLGEHRVSEGDGMKGRIATVLFDLFDEKRKLANLDDTVVRERELHAYGKGKADYETRVKQIEAVAKERHWT